ncbi:flagellar hook capping FlgD N-terminal domain-containing protein [Luteimonas sp. 3794]|uniref:flagellar hook capping FlgD N-terminal domain-containing protein n=1 Tax=Luteimonas sp. 3794 TaxID=2817730 RepID=UPI002864D65F|nr:flagellar hook capping FlgD N-terminal domain-containing protein [Luteimonas sp. 3794]MDR6990879.1 flagellar basal-body rod modification protein FlgD [Luteimonas sp. 3794]
MSTIANDITSSLGLTGAPRAADKKAESLGQADFLRLMTEQLKHQDPLKPMENSAFLGQLAQFSTVQGIQGLNATVNGFAGSMATDQLLRGATMVGRDVLLPSSRVALPAEGDTTGIVAAPSSGMVTFEITDANGLPVRQFTVPAKAAGEVAFAWDGKNAAGERLPAGPYGITAKHVTETGTSSNLGTYVRGKVESVSVGSDGLYLDLEGLGTAPLSHVLRVG